MQILETVKMKVYGGEANLVVVQRNSTHVNVCTPEEFEKAKKERRQPTLIGFPITEIINTKL